MSSISGTAPSPVLGLAELQYEANKQYSCWKRGKGYTELHLPHKVSCHHPASTLPATTETVFIHHEPTQDLPSRVLGLVSPNCTTGFSKMAWKRGLLVSMPLSKSSGEGFLSPSSHSHWKKSASTTDFMIGYIRMKESQKFWQRGMLPIFPSHSKDRAVHSFSH